MAISSTATGFEVQAWRFHSTVAFSGFPRHTGLDITSFFRYFLDMADVSDPKINEGASVNPS